MERTEIYQILESQYFGDQPHEQQELRDLSHIVDDSIRQIFDVGASLGQYTREFASLAPQAKIFSIESDPIRADRLRQNSQSWATEFGAKIEIVEALAADMSGESEFFTTNSNISGSINPHEELTDSWSRIRVPAITLNDVAERFDNTFVKMDIEGGEYAALEGASKLLNGANNVFLVELHVWGDESRGKKVADVLDIFFKHGYRIKKLHNHHFFYKDNGPNPVGYALTRAFFFLKELVYFSPLRVPARRLNRLLRGLKG